MTELEHILRHHSTLLPKPLVAMLLQMMKQFKDEAIKDPIIVSALSIQTQWKLPVECAWLIASMQLLESNRRLMENARIQITHEHSDDLFRIFVIDAIERDALSLCAGECR